MDKKKIENLLTERVEELCKKAKNVPVEEQKMYSEAILLTIRSLKITVNGF